MSRMPAPLKSYHLAWLSFHPERSEEWLRSRLADGFHVHHVDGDHYNDAPDNLALVEGADHMRLHGMKCIKPPRLGPKKRDRNVKRRVDVLAPAVLETYAISPDIELRDALSEFGWSQRAFALRIGVHPNTVYRWSAKDLGVPGPVLAYIRLWRQIVRIEQ